MAPRRTVKDAKHGMKVLMLGWEFPPFITGGLGTACYGLTRAMDRRGIKVNFVLPKSAGDETAEHVRLVSPKKAAPLPPPTQPVRDAPHGQSESRRRHHHHHQPGEAAEKSEDDDAGSRPHATAEPYSEPFRHVEFFGMPSGVFPAYEPPATAERHDDSLKQEVRATRATIGREGASETRKTSAGPKAAPGDRPAPASETESVQSNESSTDEPPPKPAETDYEGDMMTIVDRYAQFVLENCRDLEFDVIHAHDWMTYPAGIRIARATGKPLVVHIHSTEFDRSGEQVNPQIYDIERRGMHAALRVVAVSQLTKNVVMNKYHLPDERVEVVYNGVDLEPSEVGMEGIRSRDKIVLYFGRITYQKGPEYFIKAAKRVLEVLPDVKFVVAGSGDLAKRMIEMAAEMGIGHKVLFTGFLRGNDIKRVFSLADLYVMPSISEPFGIAPLEAMSHNVPVLISRSSGVSEVLNHALKVDFWDVDDMANKIVAVLRHPPLSQMLKEHGAFEVRRLTWDGAAERCEKIYQQVVQELV